MAKSRESSSSENWKNRATVFAIIVGTLWGIYAFYVKEISIPKSAPVNITVDLSLRKTEPKEIKGNGNKNQARTIEANVSAKNPSSRTIYLLPSVFVVTGFKIKKEDEKSDLLKRKEEIKKLSGYPCGLMTRHYRVADPIIVTVGELLTDAYLRPGEEVRKDLIFYVPRGQYDMIKVDGYIPTLANKLEGRWTKWKLFDVLRWKSLNIREFKWDEAGDNTKFISFFIVTGDQRYPIYSISGDGILKKNKYPREIKTALDYLEYQGFRTSGMISIW
jgi:hypothetical protein